MAIDKEEPNLGDALTRESIYTKFKNIYSFYVRHASNPKNIYSYIRTHQIQKYLLQLYKVCIFDFYSLIVWLWNPSTDCLINFLSFVSFLFFLERWNSLNMERYKMITNPKYWPWRCSYIPNKKNKTYRTMTLLGVPPWQNRTKPRRNICLEDFIWSGRTWIPSLVGTSVSNLWTPPSCGLASIFLFRWCPAFNGHKDVVRWFTGYKSSIVFFFFG